MIFSLIINFAWKIYDDFSCIFARFLIGWRKWRKNTIFRHQRLSTDMCFISFKPSLAKRDKIEREKKTEKNQDLFWVEKKFPSESSGFESETDYVLRSRVLIFFTLTCDLSDGDLLHQVLCDFFNSWQSYFFGGLSKLDPWHPPLRWKLMIKSQTDGGFVLGGANIGLMYNILNGFLVKDF